ncbi:hypothetical protein GCM10027098_20610 [Bowmanella dokdonensis]
MPLFLEETENNSSAVTKDGQIKIKNSEVNKINFITLSLWMYNGWTPPFPGLCQAHVATYEENRPCQNFTISMALI